MAQLVVAAAGAAIGGATLGTGVVALGMTGTSIGWLVGSLVGSMLFAEKSKGPEIGDGNFTSNIYGQAIPANYGTMAHAGQVAWWSGLIVRTEEVGGKGGGGAEVQKARMNLLLAVCEGPQDAVLRIWANGRLIANFNGIGYDLDGEVLPAGEVRVYLGTETQTADPTYEAAVGSANAVPYRGMVMVAIDGLEGEMFANRPPTFKIEVAQDSSVAEPEIARTVIIQYADASSGENLIDAGDFWAANGGAAQNETVFVTKSSPAESSSVPSVGSALTEYVRGQGVHSRYLFVAASPSYLYRYDLDAIGGPAADPTIVNGLAFWLAYNLEWHDGHLYLFSGYAEQVHRIDPDTMTVVSSCALNEPIEWFTISADGAIWWTDLTGGPGEPNIYRTDFDTATTDTYVVSGVTGFAGRIGYDPDRDAIVAMASDGILIEFSCSSRSEVQRFTGLPYDNQNGGPFYDAAAKLWWVCEGSDLHRINLETGIHQTLDISSLQPTTFGVIIDAVVPDGSGGVYVSETTDGGSKAFLTHYGLGEPAIIRSPVTLQSIIEDICERSGLPSANLDATAGTDLVAGYKLASQTSARQAIEALVPGYFFDLVESGTELILRKRGAASVATIDSGELGAHIFQVSQANPEPGYDLEHIDEEEVPRSLELTYVDFEADYDPGTQKADRQVGTAKALAQIQVPVVFNGGAEEASRAAYVNLLHAHASKNPISIKLSHAYDYLEGADAIDVPLAAGITQRIRINNLTRARPLLEIDGVFEEQSVYTQVMGGVPRYQGPRQSGIGTIGDTLLALLDLPPLREQDDTLLVYSAMARDTYDAAWPGASLYRSADGGATYAAVYSSPAGATIGEATTALGNWTGGNVWDDVNMITVELTSGTFSSAADIAVYNGANAIAVQAGDDWEVVQFANAVLVGTNTWQLSRLLRGRKGTERCQGGHAIGDRVVLLSATSLRHVDQVLAEIGAQREYKGVTAGQTVADSVEQPFTLVGRSLMPLSPVQIAGERAGGDITLTWVRRARLYDAWDAPLDEPSESYEVDIYDGTTVVRTLAASTPTVTYTAAQQTTDFGAPQSAVDVAVYQISSRVGRGHAGEATV